MENKYKKIFVDNFIQQVKNKEEIECVDFSSRIDELSVNNFILTSFYKAKDKKERWAKTRIKMDDYSDEKKMEVVLRDLSIAMYKDFQVLTKQK